MRVERVNSTFGARVTGIDLREPVDETTRDALAGLLWEYGALVLPRQQSDHAQMHDFVSIFAPPGTAAGAPVPGRR